MDMFIASLNFTAQPTFRKRLACFLADRNPVWKLIGDKWHIFTAWMSQRHVVAVVGAWTISFIVVNSLIMFVFLTIGFGPAGIIPGSAAAAFQGWMYGAWTPAGGIFAVLTSSAMTFMIHPLAVVFAAVVATGVAAIVWIYGVGR